MHWDIFCRVVDNFGDAGVCWRLARQLVADEGARVTLWIDGLDTLRRLNPLARDADDQEVEGVRVRRWPGGMPDTPPGDVIVEAFGCGLPDGYVSALAGARSAPLWIVLEYLSAEPWVREHHLLPSPHPSAALERYFFFPGFTEGTGGLLREADLFARRDRFGEAQLDAFWRSMGHEPVPADATAVSMFAYEGAPLGELLECWERGAGRTIVAIPESRLQSIAAGHFGAGAFPVSSVLKRGALEVRAVPFLPQAAYDELLWACDFNFVRGEDSFVRAQWAARPFAWHAYPQAERAHERKLEAFLALYDEGLPEPARDAIGGLMRRWNQIPAPGVRLGRAWAACAAQREVLRAHAVRWAGRAAAAGPLAANLARFCSDKLK